MPPAKDLIILVRLILSTALFLCHSWYREPYVIKLPLLPKFGTFAGTKMHHCCWIKWPMEFPKELSFMSYFCGENSWLFLPMWLFPHFPSVYSLQFFQNVIPSICSVKKGLLTSFALRNKKASQELHLVMSWFHSVSLDLSDKITSK